MSRNVVLILIGLALVVGISSAYLIKNQQQKTASFLLPPTSELVSSTPTENSPTATFTEIKSAHYVASLPKNNEILTSPPTEVKINFNFILGSNSIIKISKDGQPLSTSTPTISNDQLSLSVPFSQSSGSYQVDYKACWPDKSCQEGSFGFVVQ